MRPGLLGQVPEGLEVGAGLTAPLNPGTGKLLLDMRAEGAGFRDRVPRNPGKQQNGKLRTTKGRALRGRRKSSIHDSSSNKVKAHAKCHITSHEAAARGNVNRLSTGRPFRLRK